MLRDLNTQGVSQKKNKQPLETLETVDQIVIKHFS